MDGCQEARNAITITEVPCPQCGAGVEVFIRDGSPAADAVVKAMGAGRAINGGSYYTFEADVLVIIGTDYQPIV